MAETKGQAPMNAEVAKALKDLTPLIENEQLPSHYRHKLAVLMRGLEILGTEIRRREKGAAKAMSQIAAVDPSLTSLIGAQNGNQGA